MAQNLHSVPIGGVMVSDDPEDILVVYGLGSCVVICLYDPHLRVGGMMHALLPTSTRTKKVTSSPAKFVDQGISWIMNALIRYKVNQRQLKAYVCGGAQMITAPGFNDQLNIGDRNVEAARRVLRKAGIRIAGESTGGTAGRTVRLDIATGQVTVRSLGKNEQTL